jgi:hypothetical protein
MCCAAGRYNRWRWRRIPPDHPRTIDADDIVLELERHIPFPMPIPLPMIAETGQVAAESAADQDWLTIGNS